MDIDILRDYFPEENELDPERIRLIRSGISSRIRESAGDVDTSPNSPLGDLFVTPAAVHDAMLEEAWRRFTNDLDPENAAQGVIYNCDFFRKYLSNFGLYNPEDHKSYGIIRLIFQSNENLKIDRSTLFRVNNNTFRIHVPYPGPLQLIREDNDFVPNKNQEKLIKVGFSEWAVDVLVEGAPGPSVPAGNRMQVDRTISNLVRVETLTDFTSGFPPSRLQDLARRTRYNFHSRTPNTKTGVISYINQRIPDVVTVGCVTTGDPELARGINNTLSIPAAKADVLVRGDLPVSDSFTVRIPYKDFEGERKFFGKIDFPEIPIEIISISTNGIEFGNKFLVSCSKDPSEFPALSASYGDQESFIFNAPIPRDEDTLEPLVQLNTETENNKIIQYADFTIQYKFDPYLAMINNIMKGPEKPIGVDLYVKHFTPIKINSLKIYYNRKSGVSLNLSGAREEILTFLNRHNYDNPSAGASIVDSMAYAGAHSVNKIEIDSTVNFSVAGKVYCGDMLNLPATKQEYEEFISEIREIPSHSVGNIYESDFSFFSENEDRAVCGPRSVSWLAEENNLHFIEEKSI